MAKHFLIVHPSDEVQLLISQYLAIGWHDAEVEERSAFEDTDDPARFDAVIIDQETSSEVPAKTSGVPVIVLGEEHKDDENLVMHLILEELTATRLNGALSTLMRRAELGSKDGNKSRKAPFSPSSGSFELPPERLEALKGYRLIKELGHGGMSRVFLAEDEDDGKYVAIKSMRTDLIEDERMIERFIREFNILSTIDSAHVVKIYDQTFSDKSAYIIMEYFPSGDLAVRIRSGVNGKKAIDYLTQMVKGLAPVHQAGIIHRDLKPGNVMFRKDERLAIVDFGLARVSDESMQLTRHGEVYGTPSYVSPEQARGKEVDKRSDIYTCGIIIYEMLTGKRPFRADNPMALFYKHVHSEVPKLPDKYSYIQPLVNKLMAKKPEDRFQTAEELLQALDGFEAD
ncbi:MAG: hypothetical protein BMS9Abin15_1149 [Gammaproteobacteria bacterium]|nr:MAG: hypothetical protein BMS9Abin15_1149 [Gammaproteobacteria bacterium]